MARKEPARKDYLSSTVDEEGAGREGEAARMHRCSEGNRINACAHCLVMLDSVYYSIILKHFLVNVLFYLLVLLQHDN